MRGSKEGKARFFSIISCKRTRGNEHKLKYRKFHLNIYVITVRVVKH